MSTNKTENYHLHAWEPGDDFLLSEINENFAALDGVLTQGLDRKTEIVVGSYVGNFEGTWETARRFFALGFTPRAVLILPQNGTLTTQYYGGLAVTGSHCQVSSDTLLVEIGEGGFYARSSSVNCRVNEKGRVYHYIAFR